MTQRTSETDRHGVGGGAQGRGWGESSDRSPRLGNRRLRPDSPEQGVSLHPSKSGHQAGTDLCTCVLRRPG
jgi:hypothetical protein